MTNTDKQHLPFLHITKVIDELTKRAIPYQQTLLYAENMLPEHIECAYKTKLLITKTYSVAHNIQALYGGKTSPLKLANYNVEYFLSAALEKIKSLYNNPAVNIDIICSAECKKVSLDIRRTSLILFNLISNAVIHNGSRNKQITITARVKGDTFLLSVRDNGKCIPKKKQSSVFSAHEGKLSTSALIETGCLFNYGTGLAVSRKAAEEMNGSLVYIPTSEGNLFELSVPQREELLSISEITYYEPGVSEIEECLADSILMFYLEKEKPTDNKPAR